MPRRVTTLIVRLLFLFLPRLNPCILFFGGRVIWANKDTRILDFRMLAKAGKEGKMLSKKEIEHLMALFGTFPPDVESEP